MTALPLILGLTRQPIHKFDSPDTKRLDSMTLYAWPVVFSGRCGIRRSGRNRTAIVLAGAAIDLGEVTDSPCLLIA